MIKKRLTEKRPQTGRFVIGESFQKISLVEGIRMTGAMKKRAADANRQEMSSDEYRRSIVRSHRKG